MSNGIGEFAPWTNVTDGVQDHPEMTLDCFRRKSSELPLFNGRRNGSRSSSPYRKSLTRKHVFLCLFIFILLILLFRSTGSSKPKRRVPTNRYEKYCDAREDLFNHRLFFIKSVATICTNLNDSSPFWPQSAARYVYLRMEENVETNHKYYFGLMLGDSANHLPTIMDNLLRVIYHVGEKNMFMSIYEAGSSDDGHTTAMIETIRTMMETIGLEYHIEIVENRPADPWNGVLRPLKEMYKSSGRVFNSVVMMGDDLWCTEEFLELLFQSRAQQASITCSTDVRLKDNTYSISPGHDVNGNLFHEGKISSYIQDEFTASRFRNNSPIRVQSCFSSITILDPTPLYPPYDLSFSIPNLSQTDGRSSQWESKCGFSPELDLALRYSACGFNREMLVPRTQTTNHLLDFFKMHRTPKELADREQLHKQLGVWLKKIREGKAILLARIIQHWKMILFFKIVPAWLVNVRGKILQGANYS